MPYIPHTKNDKEQMLAAIGAGSIDDLFDEIPSSLLFEGFKSIPEGLNEQGMRQLARQMAERNNNGICFMGAGSYEHHIPSTVWALASRGEFLTAYTPYQAEASQGSLQLIYEFQTMIAELTGMDVANASLYDGATALAEAALMAVRLNKKNKSRRILVAGTVHPFYRQTLDTILRNQHIETVAMPFDNKTGTVNLQSLEQYQQEDISAIIIPQPNFFGCLEAVDELTDWAAAKGAISIAVVNPVSLAMLKPPGQWGREGVDIACGEGQPLGIPMASGGPYFGFFSCRMEHVRQMPGRLIGRTLDKDGQSGYTLTLQAREQHIRRGKATSNICTNQGLMVTAATIYMSLMGAEGLRRVAEACYARAHELVKALTAIDGVEKVFDAPYFNEALLRLNKPLNDVLPALAKAGVLGGYPVEEYYPELKNCLLVCATEMRSSEDIDIYSGALASVLKAL